MRPRRRHVYAPRGYDLDREIISGGPALAVGTPLPVGQACLHGGQYFKGIPMCGACLYDPSRKYDDRDKALAFGKQLNDICVQVSFRSAHRAFERTLPIADRKNICFMAIWKNLLTIFKAKNPLGLAHTIADRALIDEERRSFRWIGKQPAIGDGEKESGDTDSKLEELSQEAVNRESFKEESVRIFPDVKLVWTQANVKRFMELADEAMKKLPSWPLSAAEAIKWRCGFFGGGEIPWPDISRRFSDPAYGRPVTERRVRYAVQRGLSEIKDYILSRLTPDLGEATLKIK